MKLSRERLIEVLRDVLAVVEGNDSLDGTLTYQATHEPHVFDVSAFYRVGNSQGQGGCVVIERSPEPDDEEALRTWPDGQVREEEPYRCGAFIAAIGEQCTKLSDHDGLHEFASEIPSV